MAQRSGLFDSTEIVETIDGYPRGNRAETADFFAKYFSNFIDNGVFMEANTSFQVLTAGGMNVTVKKGSCFINGYMAFDDEDEVFTLTAGHTHWFVQRAHLITGGDITKTWVVDAAEGELPLRDGAYYDLLIAKVVIPSGATAITDGMITDYRYDKTVCGTVTSLKPSVVPTLPDDVIKYVSNSLFRTVGGVDIIPTHVATGSYIGTGTPPTLTFPFTPKAVLIISTGYNSKSSSDRVFGVHSGIAILLPEWSFKQTYNTPYPENYGYTAIAHGAMKETIFNDNTVTWSQLTEECKDYMDAGTVMFEGIKSTNAFYAVAGFCYSGTTYHYISIG